MLVLPPSNLSSKYSLILNSGLILIGVNSKGVRVIRSSSIFTPILSIKSDPNNPKTSSTFCPVSEHISPKAERLFFSATETPSCLETARDSSE